jgi:hypothetical protein
MNDNVRTNAPLTRTYKTSDGETILLNYLETVDSVAYNDCDVYVDGNGNRYTYDFEGKLMGILYASGTSADLTDNRDGKNTILGEIDLDDAKVIAENYAKQLYADRFDGMEYYSDRITGTGNYNVTFAKTYGKDNFLCGKYCSVTVNENGKVIDCSMLAEYDMTGFDVKLLDNLTREDVDEYVAEGCEKLFGEAKDVRVNSYELVEKDGELCVQTTVVLNVSKYPSADAIEEYRIDFAKGATNMDLGMKIKMYYWYPLEK